MSPPVRLPGLSGDWLNAWLAALGITVLVPGVRLAWTDGTRPIATVTHPDAGDLYAFAALLAQAFPNQNDLDALAITPKHVGSEADFDRKISMAAYRARSVLSRAGDPSLGWVATDLAPANNDDSLQTSAFYTAGPGTVGSIHDRLTACRLAISDIETELTKTFAGTASRIQKFGLGFDYRRILSPTDPSGGNWILPCIEVLAFYGLAFHPVRGAGSTAATTRATTRGWERSTLRTGAYTWPTWSPPLDAAAIDALLDRFWSGSKVTNRLPVTASYETIPYKPLATADNTRGYGSRRTR